ncbi:maleylacetate reductase [Pseudorhodoferax sp.]|uniref:maleylacetate reductase n=1 Tax=Pseudorhodoferax sp. TaxID=1993553 RepID=UPI002DD6A3E5|nr:maleylacetate reductase [Pseudorhodoferax sp.]
MQPFVYSAEPQRVVFGAGSVQQLSEELDRLDVARALVLCTPGQRDLAQALVARLGARAAGLFDEARMHVPIETARRAQALAARLGADAAVAVGGGSTVGLGKAIALDSGLPIVAVPTTYAGSEMTSIFGLTEAGVKRTGRDARVRPRTVVYDPELTHGLAMDVSVASGLNAIAHAAEALYAADRNPVTDLMALEGVAAMGRALPALAAAGTAGAARVQAREQALYAAWLCGTVLGSVSMALHHKLCHTLGGSFDLPHAQTHAAVLPHALAYNASHAGAAMARLAGALGAHSAAAGVFDLAQACGAPTSLRALGLARADLDRVLDLALQNRYPNPRPLEPAALRQLLEHAYEGVRPD